MDAKAAARPAGGLELAAQRADTLLHPEDSVAGAFRGTAGVRPVPSSSIVTSKRRCPYSMETRAVAAGEW